MLNSINIHVPEDVFEPGLLSNAELHWLADHVKEPPVSAFMDPLPDGVNRAAVEPLLQKFYELTELEKHRKISWVGHTAVLDSIQAYLEWQDRANEISRRTRGRIGHASQYHWDDAGRAFKFAIGADSAPLVRTAILDDGSRKTLGVNLTGSITDVMRDLSDVAPWIKAADNPDLKKDRVIEAEAKDDGSNGSFTCSICNHVEEFTGGSRGRKMAALGRMSKHLKNNKSQSTRHRMLYSRSFPSS